MYLKPFSYVINKRNENGTYCLYIKTIYNNRKTSIEIVADNIIDMKDALNIEYKLHPVIRLWKQI